VSSGGDWTTVERAFLLCERGSGRVDHDGSGTEAASPTDDAHRRRLPENKPVVQKPETRG
jgi:hypothetical protein